MTTPDFYNQIQQLLSTPKRVVIVPHKSPDGDAIGSITGLYGYLNQLSHHVSMIAPNDFPEFLKWLPDSDQVINYEKHKTTADALIAEADIIFLLDHNALHRTGAMQETLTASQSQFVLIDHHQQPDDFDFMFSDTSMSSTCQMVYHFLEGLNATESITANMATSLYTGIVTDTGNFKYRATTATTMRVAAALMEKGANGESINRNLFDANSLSRLKLLSVALKNMVVLPEYRTAYITITQKELDENHFSPGDTEGFVNYALSLKDVVFAQIFIEKADEHIIKTSLRSKATFDVNEMARTHWNGGGHVNAAGGKSDDTMQVTIQKLIAILPLYEEALHNATI